MNQPTDLLFCIQCRDLESDTTGDFVYHRDRPFRAISPVFNDLIGLYQWLHERDLAPGMLADFAVYAKINEEKGD